MSSKSEFHAPVEKHWLSSNITLVLFVGLVIAAFVGWIFFYHPAQFNYGVH